MDAENKISDTSNEPRGLSSRACDNCRLRKIKCDRTTPCSNCRVSASACRTSPRIKEQRQRVLISHQYEKKIGTIDERLSAIERLLQNVVLSIPSANQSQPGYGAAAPPPQHNDSQRLHSVIKEPEAKTPNAHFEGESALSAQSVLASAIFEKTMGSNPSVGQNPAVIQALSSLRDIVEAQTRPSEIHCLKFPDQQPAKDLDLSKLELPPLDVVLSLLRFAKQHFPLFFLTFPMMDLSDFTQACKDLYFCTDEYSSARFAIVNCILSYLFIEFTYYGGADDAMKARFKQCSELCRLNFEATINGFDLFMEPSFDNVMALGLGAYHATEHSKLSLCWNFIAVAARMCQSLGYHRTVSKREGTGEDSEDEVNAKRYLFWFIYIMDKTISLCLGRTSTLQDYDIAIDYPALPTDPALRPWRVLCHSWIDYSKIVGKTYEHLFSASALSDSAGVRSRKAHDLATDIKHWRDRVVQIETGDAHHSFFFAWMAPSADLSYYLLLTLVYRVLPPSQPPETPSGLSLLCIDSARKSLQLHQKVMLSFGDTETYLMKGYLDWTLLLFPFVPFLVIFCHVISSGDLSDLRLLGEVATQLQAAGTLSEGVERLSRLCTVFHQVAKVYMDAKLQEAENLDGVSQFQPPANPGGQFDNYLNALGLFPPMGPLSSRNLTDVSTNCEGTEFPGLFDVDMAQSLEDWYLGNRHMMGLLESDF